MAAMHCIPQQLEHANEMLIKPRDHTVHYTVMTVQSMRDHVISRRRIYDCVLSMRELVSGPHR